MMQPDLTWIFTQNGSVVDHCLDHGLHAAMKQKEMETHFCGSPNSDIQAQTHKHIHAHKYLQACAQTCTCTRTSIVQGKASYV